jgi:hypothetical protein
VSGWSASHATLRSFKRSNSTFIKRVVSYRSANSVSILDIFVHFGSTSIAVISISQRQNRSKDTRPDETGLPYRTPLPYPSIPSILRQFLRSVRLNNFASSLIRSSTKSWIGHGPLASAFAPGPPDVLPVPRDSE